MHIDQREYYALEAGEPLRLAISWGFFSRTLVIYLDNQEIGRIPRSKITKPHEFILNDGSRLTIQQVPSFKILGIGFQPYLHLSRDGQDLPGLIASPEQSLSNAKGWIVWLIVMKLLQAILSPNKGFILPSTLQGKEILEWQQGVYGSLAIGLILLGILALPKRLTKQMLTVGLFIILGDFILRVICVLLMLCKADHANFLTVIQGMATVSLYQALRTKNKPKS